MSSGTHTPFSSFRGIWPVVQRELRVGAHHAFNHWLRIAAGAVGVLILYFQTKTDSSTSSAMGTHIFISLHFLVLILLLVTIPAMTADCLAREKREGTLGLLFMTPLSAEGIVIGKTLVQALRAWSLWLSILPVLTIPFLLGGITWINVAAAILLELSVAFLALAAGLLIASTTQVRILAVVLAEIVALIFVTVFGFILAVYYSNKFGVGPTVLNDSIFLLWEFPLIISLQTGIPPMAALGILLKSLFLVFLVTFFCIRIAARHIKQNWRDKSPSRRQQWWIERFCTELGKDAFHRKMQRTLDWNPIAFLQQYSWKNRLSKWGLCLLFVIIQCARRDQLTSFQSMTVLPLCLLVILAAMFTFVGVSSFLTEKQNGALELILITPLNVNQIIFGRAWGLWKQFLPAFLALLLFHFAALWIHFSYMRYDFREFNDVFITDWIIICGFFSLPFFATYAALRVRYLLGAALLTWAGLFLGTIFGFTFANYLTGSSLSIRHGADALLLALCIGFSYAAFVALTFFLLRHSLSRRIYSF